MPEHAELRRRWEAWESNHFPKDGFPSGWAHDDLALADGELAWELNEYFEGHASGAVPDPRPGADIERLRTMVEAVEKWLPELGGSARAYFAEAVAISKQVVTEDQN